MKTALEVFDFVASNLARLEELQDEVEVKDLFYAMEMLQDEDNRYHESLFIHYGNLCLRFLGRRL